METQRMVYTIPETAEILRVSVVHCYLLAKQGKIPTIKIGVRRIAVPAAALAKMLENAGQPKGS